MRSLGRAGVEVHAFAESPGVPLVRSVHLHRPHPMPRVGDDGDRAALAALDRAAGLIGRRAVLIPMDDRAALVAARLPARLRSRFLLPDTDPGLPARLADKAELARICQEFGLAHPETELPATPGEARAAALRLGLPLVAKWSRPWLLPSGADGLRSTTVLRSVAEVLRLHARTAEAGSPLLLQRLLPSRAGADWFFHGCFGEGGRLLAGGTGRKELAWPVGAGLTAVGSWLPHAQLTRDAAGLAARLGYRGILDLDFRWDADSGAYHLLDANPRVGAQFRLFSDRSGTDVVRALHLELTGRPVPEPRPVSGRLFVTENYGPVSALLTPRARRAAPLPHPPGGGRREVETAWFASDDPAPFLAMTGGVMRRAAERAVRAVRTVTDRSTRPRPLPAAEAAPSGAPAPATPQAGGAPQAAPGPGRAPGRTSRTPADRRASTPHAPGSRTPPAGPSATTHTPKSTR
ncbi:ATP-grasp domain-containing protein [Streptomyces sp. SM14]|uniref:carboxylate--amine ligase n=1 Tax=Streptomyces sp. SM14 TaxID=1736045 RepID=UPI0021561DE1|nr:ATP-grasp domain-containing protein [Streptomyces sp. SM14]